MGAGLVLGAIVSPVSHWRARTGGVSHDSWTPFTLLFKHSLTFLLKHSLVPLPSPLVERGGAKRSQLGQHSPHLSHLAPGT